MTADEMFLQEGYVKVIEDKESVMYYYDPTREYLPIEKPSISIDKRDGFLGYTAEKDYVIDKTILVSHNLLRAIFTKYKEMGLIE